MPVDGSTPPDNVYEIIVEATDASPTRNIREYPVAVTVTDVNERPEFTGTPETSFTLDEHDANEVYTTTPLASYSARDEEGGVTWSLTGPDSSDFAIDSAGVVTFAAAPSFETPNGDNIYTFTVVATDILSRSPRLTATVDVTVTITNVEEAGTVTITGTPSGGEQLTAALADGDGTVSNLTWQWARGSTATGPWDDITGATSDGYTPVATDVAQYLKVTASYTDALGPLKTASAVTSSVVGASNAEPTFSADEVRLNLAENSPQGTDVEDPVMATDSNDDTLTYSLSDRNLGSLDADSFQVDSSTGQIRTVSGVDYDFEEKDRYLLTLSVHDSKDAAGNPDPTSDATIAVTITLENVDEPGTVGIQSLTDTNGRQLLRSTELTDPDGGLNISRTTWSRGDTAGGPFTEVALEECGRVPHGGGGRGQVHRAQHQLPGR